MNDIKKFISVIINLDKSDADTWNDINDYAFSECGCGGLEEFSLEEERVDEILGERAYSGGDIPESVIDEVEQTTLDGALCVKFFFYEEEMKVNAKRFVDFIRENHLTAKTELIEESWEDWNKEWRKHYNTIEVSDDLYVVPEWKQDEFSSKKDSCVFIYPGMGFGTGEHETTYLCLKLYNKIKNELTGKDCLDFGCGSGILGIAAIKFSNMLVNFCDIDSNALDNCLQNLTLNFEDKSLNGHQLVSRERYQGEKQYELVFANILENVLLMEKEVLEAALSSTGYLIVSGLLNHQVETIKSAYDFVETIEVVSKGDWSAILFKRI